MIGNDDNVQQQKVLPIKDVEMEQCEDHLKNLDMNLMTCAYFHVLNQEKEKEASLMALHTHISHTSPADKNNHEEES